MVARQTIFAQASYKKRSSGTRADRVSGNSVSTALENVVKFWRREENSRSSKTMTVFASRSQVHYLDLSLKIRQHRPPSLLLRKKAINDQIQNNDFVKTLLDTNPLFNFTIRDSRLCSHSVRFFVPQRS